MDCLVQGDGRNNNSSLTDYKHITELRDELGQKQIATRFEHFPLKVFPVLQNEEGCLVRCLPAIQILRHMVFSFQKLYLTCPKA